MQARFVLVLSLLIGFGVGGLAHAQDPRQDELARRHFSAGDAYFATGDYEDAAREFRRAYELSGRSALLFNIYSCEERLGRYDAAADALESFVAAGSPGMETSAPTLPARVEALRRRARETRSDALEASSEHSDESELSETHPNAPAAPVAVPPKESEPPYLAIVGFSVAGAGALAFAIMGGLALAEDDALWSTCGSACSDQQVSTLNALTLGADVSLGVAIAGAIVGIVGLVLPSPAQGENVALLPLLDGSSLGLRAGGRL